MNALSGFAIGLAAGAFGAGALLLLVQVVGSLARGQRSPAMGTALAVLMVAAKVPVLLFAWRFAHGLGGTAPGWFIGSVVLVYFALVAWAAARNR